jgi:Tfp pilus assembly protein PilF/peroxiredoxin
MLSQRLPTFLGIVLGALSLLTAPGEGAAENDRGTPSSRTSSYPAKLRPPTNQGALLQQVPPGGDAFPEERTAAELSNRLGELSELSRGGRLTEAPERLLAPDFRGGRLTPTEEQPVGGGALEVFRGTSMSAALERDRSSFGGELTALFGDMQPIRVAEFLITGIEEKREAGGSVGATVVRYDVVGSGKGAWRSERVGRWRMKWRRAGDGSWRVLEWTALADERSRAPSPVFTEVTERALGQNLSFQRQLRWGVDEWLATLDSIFARDSMGHHGVSVADVDGDGLDDFFVTQPAGFPKRLFKNRGDGTFGDITEASGLGFLDDASQAIFADVDNDGDQDLLVVGSSGLALFLNDGKGRFTRAPDAFRMKGALQGSPMSIAVADYDRDGFLDVYLCLYSYFIGANENRGGTPSPYHDAQNGPPSMLLRNDGRGHFTDVTEETGLNENNNRYGFAAAWGDYDGDGWPDLAVANDFGRKHLYHNEGLKNGKVTFKDVTAAAGVEDYGAGMSTTWVDYDNDGRMDLYFGNMWSAAGQRVTSEPGFMPEAPEEVKALYRRHARGNSLFRNRGDGTFEDVTLEAGAEMGRWAWSSDAIDFDNDGWEDLYIVNGMFTRKSEEDLDSFFWRQVVARSPLTRVTGTPYDEAWRVITRLLADHSQANHQRNVFLRNDGGGRFEEVSGAVGLDLDQDGRSFAVVDYDLDGDADLIVMGARSAPQLRVFRNDVGQDNASLALRLTGTRSNRDAIGARVTIETDTMRRTKVVQANSGFISQHSKELLFGLGKSERVVKAIVAWPSGATQVFSDLPINRRIRIEEGGAPTAEPYHLARQGEEALAASGAATLPPATWFYESFPAPDFRLPDLEGKERSLSALRGRPALLLFWAASVPESRAALQKLARQQEALAAAGVGVLTVALDDPQALAKVRAAAQGVPGLPVALGNEAVGNAYTILHHYLFVGKEDLPLPSAFLLNAKGEIVRAYGEAVEAAQVVGDASKIEAPEAERLARAVPFAGAFSSKPGSRNYLQYGIELVEQGLEAWALPAFERAAKGDPSAFALYSLGTLYVKGGQPDKARAAFERALKVKPDFAEATNSLGALTAQGGNVPAAITLFRAALESTPDYPDALNNLGYALLQTGREQEAYDLYQKALQLQPDFPEAFNNLGIYFARQGEMARAESYFKQAVDKRPGYGEAANNLALVLMTHDDAGTATSVLKGVIEVNPDFEMAYVTLAKIYLSTGRSREGTQILERLLQRNPKNPLALQMVRELRGGP